MDKVFKNLEDLLQAYDKGWISLEFYLNERNRLESAQQEAKEGDG